MLYEWGMVFDNVFERLLVVDVGYVIRIVKNLLIGFNGLIKGVFVDLMFGNLKNFVFLGEIINIDSLMNEWVFVFLMIGNFIFGVSGLFNILVFFFLVSEYMVFDDLNDDLDILKEIFNL